jgi:AI-2 transport protein TqsA
MTDPSTPSRWRDAETLRTIAVLIVIACGSWWLLGQFAAVLRPLLLAIFLAYVLMPTVMRFRKTMPGLVGVVALTGLTGAVLGVMALVTYSSLLGIQDEFPKIQKRAVELARDGGAYVEKNVPWLVPDRGDPGDNKTEVPIGPVKPAEKPEITITEQIVGFARTTAGTAAVAAASAVGEAVVAGLYLFFLLLEISRFPERVRSAYPAERADQILQVFGRISGAIIGYLKAKVISGMILALCAAIVLWGFGVKFVFLWAVFTFLCNFIPYIGSVLGYGLPAAFAGLMLDGAVKPIACAIVLLVVHVVLATVGEPMLIGKAVGLSPLIILIALTMWGSIWGLPGMFLAVPLTMVVLIVLDNIPSTRSFARLFLT